MNTAQVACRSLSRLGGRRRKSPSYWWMARPIWRRLLPQLEREAASRACWTAGSSSPIRIEMIAMTTSSSISVNAVRRRATFRRVRMMHLKLGILDHAARDLETQRPLEPQGRARQLELQVIVGRG